MDKPGRKTGLDGLFSGLTNIFQIANDLVERAASDAASGVEVHRASKTAMRDGAQTVCGVSIRVGPRVAPPRRVFGTVRRNARREPVIDDVCEPSVDVFDEGDHFLVVAELPGVDQAAVDWSITDGVRLTVRAESADRKYHRNIELSERVDREHASACHANGVLELRLWKQPQP